MKKFIYIGVVIVLVVLAISGTAIAQWAARQVTGTVEIVTGTENIMVYEDAQMKIVATTWDIGPLQLGATAKKFFMVKGLGTQSTKCAVRVSENISAWGKLRVIPEEPFYVPPNGGFQQVWVYIIANDETDLTTRDFTLEFYPVE